ncbi:uncharacterized protein BDZ99DRAFT_397766 [Mytilinidion resinicola]|uniref:DBF4-type domain-containing protein n=1 Tax=Mytilinidion resinicola TaxID=574789 RepID=A0A6A6Y736_9PEZI|nr:uncharacterized protein BDZ99DRAFT_397766 [Mytilinidion resinicola]KAF2804622.1 hypothetical protein BDZ99DRAFT_397766 [Mytilinidion resinicola]
MAAVSIPPSPQVISTMTSRRAPLANIPNAANSPFRAVAAAASKRQRSHASDQRELAYGQPPPTKKLIVEVDDAEARRHGLGRRTTHNPNAFQRKLEAAREVKAPSKSSERPQKVTNENLESIRQWQKHYKRMFPTFVFYFDSIPDDLRSRASRQAHTLGAREEKFFSKAVTHVVTTRPIPPENDSSSSRKGASRTIDPSVLDRSAENQAQTLKGRFTFEAPMPKTNNGDILHKAREMGMKIWSAEKLQRMLNTMFHTDTGEQVPEHPRRHAIAQTKAGRDVDLQQLLQNEKVNGPADRDLTVATQEMVQIRGYYIYIHDMDEQTRPCMVREYAKPATKEEGKWPQFRVTGPGKCPFVEDPNHSKRSHAQEKQSEARTERVSIAVPRTRAAAAMEAAKDGQSVNIGERRVLAQNNNLARRPTSAAGQPGGLLNQSKPLDPPALVPAKRGNPDSMPPMFGSAQASIRGIPRFAGGEPVASGIQPSNVTSAIRSQMISSTAAAPGARAGTSKEMHQLKRKVLEKNNAPSASSMPSSYMNDVRAAINNDCGPPPRAAKRKAQDTLTHIHEDMTVSEEEKLQQKVAVVRRKKATEKELKPGYCENCREKFNDFDEHITSRKHRKFAMTLENWRELDALLSQLVRR